MSHLLYWTGDLGVFLVTILLPKSEHRHVICCLLRWLKDIRAYKMSEEKRQHLADDIVCIMAKLEFLLPPYFFTIMNHLCLHLPEVIQQYGALPFIWNMLDEVNINNN